MSKNPLILLVTVICQEALCIHIGLGKMTGRHGWIYYVSDLLVTRKARIQHLGTLRRDNVDLAPLS